MPTKAAPHEDTAEATEEGGEEARVRDQRPPAISVVRLVPGTARLPGAEGEEPAGCRRGQQIRNNKAGLPSFMCRLVVWRVRFSRACQATMRTALSKCVIRGQLAKLFLTALHEYKPGLHRLSIQLKKEKGKREIFIDSHPRGRSQLRSDEMAYKSPRAQGSFAVQRPARNARL
jgi:hypothetical protein